MQSNELLNNDRAKIAALMLQMGDEEGARVYPKSMVVPKWGRRFVFDSDSGALIKVQEIYKDASQPRGVRFRTIGESFDV